MEWFGNGIDAKIVIEEFRRQYNEVRPHPSRATDSGRVQSATVLNNQHRKGHFLSPHWTEACQQVSPLMSMSLCCHKRR